MRIGIHGGSQVIMGLGVDACVEHARAAEREGFTGYWLPQLAAPDALTVLGAVGRATSTIELGTAVVATWPRHPLMLAGQALTASEMAGGRLVLGIGVAHKAGVEARFRVPFERPARHVSEYLDVLLPALAGDPIDARGEIWSGVEERIPRPAGVEPPSVMLAAMGPRMLALAGARTDGTVLWLSGPRAVAEVIRPALEAAAAGAGRPAPRIVASVPVCVTDRPDEVRSLVRQLLGGYDEIPSYRRVMDQEGVAGVAEVSVIGGAAEVTDRLAAFAAAGVTDFVAVEFTTTDDEAAATRAVLAEVGAAG